MKKRFFLIGFLALTSACNLPDSTPAAVSAPTQTPPAAPTTVSVAPSLGPTETAVPTPEPPSLYFTEEFEVESPYWEFFQTGGEQSPVTSFQNNTLQISISSPDTWLIGIHNAHSYKNVFVRAKTTLNPIGSAGLICRYTEEEGWYEFNAANDGNYSVLLGQWLSPGVVKYIPIVSDGSNSLRGNTTSEIGFFCEDDFLQLYVNDALLRRVDVTNYGLTEGKIGITASSFANFPMTANFEWVSVSEK